MTATTQVTKPLSVACLVWLGLIATAHAALVPIDPAPFKLQDAGTWGGKGALIDELARTMPAASVARVVADGNRRAEPLAGSRALGAIQGVTGGFRWRSDDDRTGDWYPQGISGSGDATPAGTWGGVPVLLVSWYSSRGAGARVSFVQAANLSTPPAYRHVLLVDPIRGSDGAADFRPVPVHAGGIAWYGPYLYVVDTHVGVRVFDVRRMLRTTSSEDAIGRDSQGRYRAFGYKYVLPQVGAYVQPPGGDLRFSFASADRTASPHSLVTGEYCESTDCRLVRWPLNRRSSRLATSRRGVVATQALVTDARRMQGAASVGPQLLVASSAGKSQAGSLALAQPGTQPAVRGWAVGAEDLSYSPRSRQMYSLTEYPGQRTVFATGVAPARDLVAPVVLAGPLISPGRRWLSVTLSERARVRVSFERRLRGRYIRLGTIVRRAKQGANRLRMPRRVGNVRLRRGRYRVTLRATDRAGNVGGALRFDARLSRSPHRLQRPRRR